MLKVVDKLRSYVLKEFAAGKIRSGGRLPSYNEIAAVLHSCHSSIHAAMSQLALEGLVRIEHGNGTYLTIGDRFTVGIELHYEEVNREELTSLLNRLSKGLALNVEFIVGTHWEHDLFEEQGIPYFSLTEHPFRSRRSLFDLRQFESYRQNLNVLAGAPQNCPWAFFPFGRFTHALGVNGRLLRSIGMSADQLTPDLGWWKTVEEKCRKQKISVSGMALSHGELNLFHLFWGVLLTMWCRDGFQENLLVSAAGRLMLKMVHGSNFYVPDTDSGRKYSFFSNSSLLHFSLGSYMCCQNHTARRPDIHADELIVIPYEVGGRRILPYAATYLSCIVPPDCPPDRIRRLDRIFNLLVSRRFQLEFCNISGLISFRKDIRKTDYTWYNAERDGFFPGEGDLSPDSSELLPYDAAAALSLGLELYKKMDLSPDRILPLLEEKIPAGTKDKIQRLFQP